MTAPATDHIDYGKLTALVNARPDRGTRRALYAALNGINDAERTMREKTAALRAALDDTGAHLDATRLRAGPSRSSGAPPTPAAPALPTTSTGRPPPPS